MKASGVKRWFGKTGTSLFDAAAQALRRPAVNKTLHCGGSFLLAFLLSRAVLFGGYAPFGLGAVAAAGLSLGGLFGFAGSVLSYFYAPEGVDGLKYIAAAILIFSARLVFRDTRFVKKAYFMPAVAAASSAVVGFVILSETGAAMPEAVLFAAEIVLAGGSAYFFHLALTSPMPRAGQAGPKREMKRVVGTLALLTALILSLYGIYLPGDLSLGRLFAMLAVMLAAYYGGIGAGSACGIAAGAAMDAVGGAPLFSLTYALSGMTAGAFSGAGRLICILTYFTAGAISLLWTSAQEMRLPVLLETVLASAVFLVLPDSMGRLVRDVLGGGATRNPEHAVRVRQHARRRLEQVAQSFRELYAMLTAAFESMEQANDADIAGVFDRAADKVCRQCPLSGHCWDKQGLNTYNVLNDVTPTLLRKGYLEKTDLPLYFSARCINIGIFITEVNREMAGLMYRRQYHSRLSESRKLICDQYSELSQVIKTVAAEVGADLYFDSEGEEKLRRYLKENRVEADVTVYRNAEGHACAEIEGKELAPLAENRAQLGAALSHILEVPMGQPEQQNGVFGQRLIIAEAEPFFPEIGVSAQKKKGQSVSGDSGTYFKSDSGQLFVILSDGMGSGKEAAVESGTAVRLLERFLRAGILPRSAIGTLNSALLLKSEDQYGLATIDLMIVDLYSGALTFYKSGAAPAYICRGQKVSRVVCGALPAGAGIAQLPQADETRLTLCPGDLVVMASDGVANPQDDEWLIGLIAQNQKEAAKAVAAQIMRAAREKYGGTDDMSVFVMRLGKRSRRAKSAGSGISGNAGADDG